MLVHFLRPRHFLMLLVACLMRKIENLFLGDVVHNDLRAYLSSGYGGRHIDDWPFYFYIVMWIEGKHGDAKRLWVDWLLREFYQFGSIKKKSGGMYQGSVHRYACNCVSSDNFDRAWHRPETLDWNAACHGAHELVERRLKMVESIKNNGWRSELSDRICAVKLGPDRYVLKGGHHRAATLYALGYSVLPNVDVYSALAWRVSGWGKLVKKFARSLIHKSTRNG